MWRTVTPMMVPGWVCVFLAAAVAADSAQDLYTKLGDDVVLEPEPLPTSEPITNIAWRRSGNLAALWIGEGTDASIFVRGSLNISDGKLTITSVTTEEAGLYEAEINNRKAGSINLIALAPVPKPSVTKACETGGAGCYLICEANTTGAEPATFQWNFGVSVKETHIERESSSNISDFSCEVTNPVSQEKSDPVFNPFFGATGGGKYVEPAEPGGPGEPAGSMNIPAGLTVFICLLSAVLLTVLIHRWRAGMWFFQKASMPWEADFWSKETSAREAAESNGTTPHQDRRQTDEETPLN